MKITLDQRSDNWHQWRSERIGASDAPVILGISPFNTPYRLWQQKLGLVPSQQITPAMQHGIDTEEEALIKYMELTGKIMAPACFEHDEFPYLVASLDGYCPDGIVEIKVPSSTTFEKAKRKEVDPWYYAQMQHQMFVTGFDIADFWCYNKQEGGILIPIERDSQFIDNMLDMEHKFYDNLRKFMPPPLAKSDYIDRTAENSWIKITEALKKNNEKLQYYKQKEEELRKKIVEIAEAQNSFGNGVKIIFSTKKGSIDYGKIPELDGVDLEKYRKESVDFSRILYCKE